MSKNEELFERAKRVIPGGVNSPVRAFGSVGGTPAFMAEGRGAKIYDADGSEYIDCMSSWGPLILGHRHPAVEAAVQAALAHGSTFGAPTAAEVELAERVCERVPSVDLVRLTNSGTEACMSAIRLARGFTGRDRLVKFTGCYHGHADSFLIQAGSGSLTFGVPSSPGVPSSLAELTLTAAFNDLDAVRQLFAQHHSEIAAVIVEPIAGNMGAVPPEPGFLQGLRQLCTDNGALLIFDEVITGFRVARGGVQDLYDLDPDITTLGKVLGGGLPLAAFGGRREVFASLAPEGPVYQAGTLSGNPLATAAGIATLDALGSADVYAELEAKGAYLEKRIREAMARVDLPLCYQRVGSLATLFFVEGPVRNLDSLATVQTELYGKFFHALLKRGVAFPPSQYELFFVSLAHEEADLDRVGDAVAEALVECASSAS